MKLSSSSEILVMDESILHSRRGRTEQSSASSSSDEPVSLCSGGAESFSELSVQEMLTVAAADADDQEFLQNFNRKASGPPLSLQQFEQLVAIFEQLAAPSTTIGAAAVTIDVALSACEASALFVDRSAIIASFEHWQRRRTTNNRRPLQTNISASQRRSGATLTTTTTTTTTDLPIDETCDAVLAASRFPCPCIGKHCLFARRSVGVRELSCSLCQKWHHASCMPLPWRAMNEMELAAQALSFVCPSCSPPSSSSTSTTNNSTTVITITKGAVASVGVLTKRKQIDYYNNNNNNNSDDNNGNDYNIDDASELASSISASPSASSSSLSSPNAISTNARLRIAKQRANKRAKLVLAAAQTSNSSNNSVNIDNTNNELDSEEQQRINDRAENQSTKLRLKLRKISPTTNENSPNDSDDNNNNNNNASSRLTTKQRSSKENTATDDEEEDDDDDDDNNYKNNNNEDDDDEEYGTRRRKSTSARRNTNSRFATSVRERLPPSNLPRQERFTNEQWALIDRVLRFTQYRKKQTSLVMVNAIAMSWPLFPCIRFAAQPNDENGVYDFIIDDHSALVDLFADLFYPDEARSDFQNARRHAGWLINKMMNLRSDDRRVRSNKFPHRFSPARWREIRTEMIAKSLWPVNDDLKATTINNNNNAKR